MHYRAVLLIALAALSFGCSSGSNEMVIRFHDDGRAKPVVAIVPVIDTSGEELPWNLSEELTYSLYNETAKRANFWIDTYSANSKLSTRLPSRQRLFDSQDLSWAKAAYPDYEFVILTELIQHDIKDRKGKNFFVKTFTPSCELFMSARIKVVDLRKDQPEVILQEVIAQNHLMPRPTALLEMPADKWKQKTYAVSPLGFSHLQLSKEIIARCEEYILLAKSR